MLKRSSDLMEEEQTALHLVCQLHPHVKRLHALFQQFAQMLRERRGEDLDQWLRAAFHAGIPELRAYVRKLRQDQQAVQAGLALKWNNGMVERHANRLKFFKRSMSGRANLICCGYGSCIIESGHEPTSGVHYTHPEITLVSRDREPPRSEKLTVSGSSRFFSKQARSGADEVTLAVKCACARTAISVCRAHQNMIQ